jgi:hypothetical protein
MDTEYRRVRRISGTHNYINDAAVITVNRMQEVEELILKELSVAPGGHSIFRESRRNLREDKVSVVFWELPKRA